MSGCSNESARYTLFTRGELEAIFVRNFLCSLHGRHLVRRARETRPNSNTAIRHKGLKAPLGAPYLELTLASRQTRVNRFPIRFEPLWLEVFGTIASLIREKILKEVRLVGSVELDAEVLFESFRDLIEKFQIRGTPETALWDFPDTSAQVRGFNNLVIEGSTYPLLG